MQVVFVFDGSEEEFRALAPGPVHRWGNWAATEINGRLIGSFELHHRNNLYHTHMQMTFMPVSADAPLSDGHIAALAKIGLTQKKGDTLRAALTNLNEQHGIDHLHPDRF